MTLKARLNKLEQHIKAKAHDSECICFPPEEPPHLELRAEIEAASAVRCPRHGKRFSRLAPVVYRVIMLPAHLNPAPWSWHTPQYIKAMEASFPADRWPAEKVLDQDGAVRFLLKDGTEIHRIAPPAEILDYDAGLPISDA